MKDGYCIVMSTFDDYEICKSVIDKLLQKELTACIQMQNIKSFYKWNGQINEDKEILLLIKTKRSLFDEIKETILSLHSYQVPQITLIPIENGYDKYLKWIDDSTK